MRFLVLFLALVISACGNDAELMNPPPVSYAQGIDLSHHNGRVAWEAVPLEEVSFVYLKATEGRDWKDPRFQANWNAALKHGFETGAYHFYLLCKSGEAQADNFIQSVEVRSDALPPAVDLEYAGNCTPHKAPQDILQEIADFLMAVEQEYGARPVIYTTQQFYNDWIAGRFPEHPIWIRKIGSVPPKLSDGRDWLIWQYTANGNISGIAGPVDVNRRREMP